jgi:hypothetical protein
MELNFNFMKKIIVSLFCMSILVLACKEPKKSIVKQKPSFDSIGKMPYEKAVIQYGKPFEDYIFNIKKDGLGGPRYTLYEKYSDFPNLDILEAVWRKDSAQNILIWYKKESDKWQPIDTIMYPYGAEF